MDARREARESHAQSSNIRISEEIVAVRALARRYLQENPDDFRVRRAGDQLYMIEKALQDE